MSKELEMARELVKTGKADAFIRYLPHEFFEEYHLHSFVVSAIDDFDKCISELERIYALEPDKKNFKKQTNVKVEIDRKTGDIKVFRYFVVVDEYIEGDEIIDEEGKVYVNEKLLDEPYLKERNLGQTDIKFPYQVPEGSYFILGDDRATSIDSRNSIIGCVNEDDIIGKVIFKVWPIKRIGLVK